MGKCRRAACAGQMPGRTSFMASLGQLGHRPGCEGLVLDCRRSHLWGVVASGLTDAGTQPQAANAAAKVKALGMRVPYRVCGLDKGHSHKASEALGVLQDSSDFEEPRQHT